MAFLASEVIDRLKFALDSEDTNFYNESRDYVPAINSAILWTLSLIEKAYGTTRLNEEAILDSQEVAIYYTNNFSKFRVPDNCYGVLAVVVSPTVGGEQTPTYTDDYADFYADELAYQGGGYPASRLSLEKFNGAQYNPFSAGSNYYNCIDEDKYAYSTTFDFRYDKITGVNDSRNMVSIKPDHKRMPVAIFYLTTPALIVDGTSEIPFSKKLFNLVFEKALAFMSIKQGEGLNVAEHTASDIQLLVTLFT